MNYDKEYFFNFDDYIKAEKNQPIPLVSYGEIKFDFYEMIFKNGVRVFLLGSMKELKAFYNYCGYKSDRVPFYGAVSDIIERVSFETLKRTPRDFIELCEQSADDKKYGMLYVPFKLSWETED
jgi:hypothetical protein